jgi:exosortase A-associated hydrolase 1
VEDDVRHGVDQFFSALPALREVVIWGLCDAASAALFYAHRDPRVSGLVLLNPWVRTDEGAAKAYLKHYYRARLLDRELWNKILRGQFDYAGAVRSVFKLAAKALSGKARPIADTSAGAKSGSPAPLPERMFDGLDRFQGKVLLIMSGNDLTAQEFSDLVKGSGSWQKLLGSSRVQRRDLPQANHTFSTRDWRDQVSSWTREWVTSW